MVLEVVVLVDSLLTQYSCTFTGTYFSTTYCDGGAGGNGSYTQSITSRNGTNTTAFGSTAYDGGAGGNGYGGTPLAPGS